MLVVEVEEDADEVEEVEEQVVAGEEVVDLHAELVVREGRLIHEYAICVFLYLSKLSAWLAKRKPRSSHLWPFLMAIMAWVF